MSVESVVHTCSREDGKYFVCTFKLHGENEIIYESTFEDYSFEIDKMSKYISNYREKANLNIPPPSLIRPDMLPTSSSSNDFVLISEEKNFI
jgi:hypothetical protein